MQCPFPGAEYDVFYMALDFPVSTRGFRQCAACPWFSVAAELCRQCMVMNFCSRRCVIHVSSVTWAQSKQAQLRCGHDATECRLQFLSCNVMYMSLNGLIEDN